MSEMSTLGGNDNERLRTVWTPEMDQYFIELMLEQVKRGNRFDDHLFSKRAWKLMSSSFTARFEFPYGKDVLKNRHKTLRNLFRSVNSMLKEDGFSWDERKQMVVADNSVWDVYLKVRFAFSLLLLFFFFSDRTFDRTCVVFVVQGSS